MPLAVAFASQNWGSKEQRASSAASALAACSWLNTNILMAWWRHLTSLRLSFLLASRSAAHSWLRVHAELMQDIERTLRLERGAPMHLCISVQPRHLRLFLFSLAHTAPTGKARRAKQNITRRCQKIRMSFRQPAQTWRSR